MNENIMTDLRVLAFDPGVDRMGIAVLDITYSPFHVTEVYRATTNGGKLERSRKHLRGIFSQSYCKMDAIFEVLDDLFEEYKPDEVASEGAFGYTRPAILISLTLVIDRIRTRTHKYLNKDVHVVAPMQTKRAVTNIHDASKEQMRSWYETCPYITKLPEEATEHEIDAVAHGVTAVMRDITKTYIPELTAKEKKKLKKLKLKEQNKE